MKSRYLLVLSGLVLVVGAVGALRCCHQPAGPAVVAYTRATRQDSSRVVEVGFLDEDGRISRKVAVPGGLSLVSWSAFSPHSGCLYLCDGSRLLALAGLRWRTLISADEEVAVAGISADGRALYSVGTTDGARRVLVWDGRGEARRLDLDLLGVSAPWSSDGRMFVATDGQHRRLVITGLVAGGRTRELRSVPLPLTGSMCWTPDGDLLYVAEEAGGQVVKRLAPVSGHVSTLPVRRREITVLAASPQGTQVAFVAASANDSASVGSLEVVELATGRCLFSFRPRWPVDGILWPRPGVLFVSTLENSRRRNWTWRNAEHSILKISLTGGRVRRALSGYFALADEVRP